MDARAGTAVAPVLARAARGMLHTNDAGWGAPQTVAGLTAGPVLLGAFVAWHRRSQRPMMPLRLFASREFSAVNAAGFLLHFAMFGAFFLVIQFLAQVRGEGPIATGLYTLPWTMMPLLVSPLAGRLGQKIHPAVLVVSGVLGLGSLIRPNRPTRQKLATYESGVDPTGPGFLQSNVRYYVFALLFVIFDVEAVFLFPWAIRLEDYGVFGLVEMGVFLFVLVLGLIYAWRKGVLRWV